tara:strand:- start:1096 stop:1356 length:261 start_codon:yes stop_codon:yes gene_type:complete
MNREELKQRWLNSPTSNVVTRTIRLEMDTYEDRLGQGTVEITSDGPDGFRQFKTHQKFPFTYLVESKEYKSGKYELLIKLKNGTVI